MTELIKKLNEEKKIFALGSWILMVAALIEIFIIWIRKLYWNEENFIIPLCTLMVSLILASLFHSTKNDIQILQEAKK